MFLNQKLFTVLHPYCSSKNKKYPDANVKLVENLSPNPEIGISLDNCTIKCSNELQCNYWAYIEPNKTCFYYNDVVPMAMESVNETGVTYYSAPTSCLSPIVAPALPEDAMELSYIQVCKGTEYAEVNRTVDTWNITTCPSKGL